MLVYHFLNSRYGLEALREGRLKISRIMDLNDPFEFLGVDLANREVRRALKEEKERLSTERGILCFSKSWRNPVLWSHYADRHRGLCLGFEIPRRLLEPVDYVDTRWPVPARPDLEFVKRLLFTKFCHWQYEQEWRAFVNLETEIGGHYFMPFSNDLQPRYVIVGDQSSITRAEVARAVKELSWKVTVFKARAAFRSFDVVRNRSGSMWA